ncbi:hypothetical protein Pla123a_26210 [Posidoniimonas polymericola]|uniref:DUF1559 domain-containing protein n=1 Tax=Posidoniimonas polymericola TaxID=2528002 RepID=A0A5C5YM59_9BACT|nr:DUF1559 domain-containing protein [Posidoniimonas polymericola]TWT75838.1 hypothetical protein Pla123a_26210 [Posidoniimonas polymericola]
MTLSNYLPCRLIAAITVSVVATPMVGCGGNSADAFRARAIQRPPDDEEDSLPAQTAPTVVAASSAPPSSVDPTAAAAAQPATAAVAAAPAAEAAPSRELPTTVEGRVARSAENLERIAAALEAYRKDKTVYPAAAVIDVSRAPLFSWRVELLPYLGHEQLYKQFDRTQPWYAPQNKALLGQIPAVFQSPDRGGTKTNYLATVGTSTIIKTPRSLNAVRVEDGLSNTALVVEADDALAVEWTQPEEYAVDLNAPKKGLGTLRGGHVFLIWGGGMVGSIPLSSPEEAFKAVYTADGGEPFTMASLNQPISPETMSVAPRPAAPEPLTQSLPDSGPVRQRTRVAAVQQDKLVSTYLSAAAAALESSDATSAWQWTYAAAALGGIPEQGYEWRPALRRPALGVHYGIGITGSSQGAARPGPSRSELEAATTPYGHLLLDVIERQAMQDSFAQRLQVGTEPQKRTPARGRGFDSRAAISVLEPGTESVLRHEAEDAGCDVLVLLEVDENAQRTRRSLRLKLLDLAARKELYCSRRLDYSSSDRDRGAPGDEDSLDRVKWELQDLVEDGLSAQPWPVRMDKRIAARRVAALGQSKDPYTPRVVGEIQYYRQQGLVDTAECLAAVEALLGDPNGANLLLGSEAKKKRELREWLPATDPGAFVAGAPSRAVKSDDR